MAYPRFADWADCWFREIAEATPDGISVVPLPNGPRETVISLPELDRRWRRRDREILGHYEDIRKACLDADVLFAYGAGIHPEFLSYLSTYNCYFFCDDPEDSPWQSSKVAPSFDAAFYANIASGFQYESWGCKNHSWLPIFTAPVDVPSATEVDEVLNSNRTESVVFIGGFDDYSSYRRLRLERLSGAFPEGLFRGRGWPVGEIKEPLKTYYLKSRIGFNIHRTTGPINRRMFQLPAHGVMQICDNKTGLGQIFELGKEVEGFDTIDEAIELTRYYLDNDQKRAAIARAGYQRFWKDYHAGAVWERLRDQLLEWGVKPGERKRGVKQKLPSRNVSNFFRVSREKIQTETTRMIRSAKAAKREYLRKDPWWKIYERVFTSEAVYLPDYGDSLTEFSKPDVATDIKKELMPSHMVRAREGAIRWAMTQLAGNAVRIGVIDPQPGTLIDYLSVDLQRRIEVLRKAEQMVSSPLDLVMCVPNSDRSQELVSIIRECAKIAPRAVYGFPLGVSPLSQYGEVYWLLKSFYENVAVFYMPNPVVPWLEPHSLIHDQASIIALATRD